MSIEAKDRRNENEEYVVALELGSSTAKIGIAGFVPEDELHTLTIYDVASLPTVDSVRYGRINNIREVTETVKKLIEELNDKYPAAGRKVKSVYISIGGRSLKAKRISSRIVLPERREITEDLIERLQEEAVNNLSVTDELVCVVPIRYNVDNQPNPRPIGALGSRIAGDFTAVLCNPSNKKDLVDVVTNRIKLNISGVSVRPIALANLVLTPKETNAGCMLVDFGAETTTAAIYKNDALQYLATIPLGSRLLTKDLAAKLALTEDEAEALKKEYGDAMPEKDIHGEEDSRMAEQINAVISARLADIGVNILAQPGFANLTADQLPGGIIVAGGGSSLKNFTEWLRAQTTMNVRKAELPSYVNVEAEGIPVQESIDVIALLNEGAESARESGDFGCLTEVKKAPAAKENEPGVLFDFNSKKAETETEDDHDEFGVPGFGEEDVFGVEEFPKERIKPKKHVKVEKIPVKEPQPEEDEGGDGGDTPPAISKVDKLINKLTKFFQVSGEDESADMD